MARNAENRPLSLRVGLRELLSGMSLDGLNCLLFSGGMLACIVLAGATLAMAGALEVSGDLIAATATLAGLVLVFIGATSTSYEGYPAEMRDRALRRRFRRRAWFGFTGFALSVVAAFLALVGKWFHQEWSAITAAALFIIALIWVIVAAYLSVRDIR